jgi:prepilin-type processing-associated H-X9-DG protein
VAPANSRYDYSANMGLFPSGQQWRKGGQCGGNDYASSDPYNDQNCDGSASGDPAVPSTSQTQLQHPSGVLMLTTTGVATDWGASNTYMTGGEYWWAGGSVQTQGAIPPASWDCDGVNTQVNDWTSWSSTQTTCGPAMALPRFRFNLFANLAWADGHAKGMRKGALGWCSDAFVAGAYVDPYAGGAPWDDSWTFGAGNACAGYTQN